MLNLVLVRSLVTVLDSGSFQLAAERLGLSQPAVSRHVQKLEDELGVPLVQRTRAGALPTPEAASFLPHARSLLRLNDRALDALRNRRLRVGASSNIGIYLLQPFLRAFVGNGGRDRVELVIGTNPQIADQLETGELDVGLLEWWDGRPGLEAHVWRHEPLVLIAPPDHPLARRHAIGRSELTALELLGGEPGTGTGRLLADYFRGMGTVPRTVLQLGSTEAVKRAVMAGIGCSLVLAGAVEAEAAAGRLAAVPLLDPPLSKTLYIVLWRSRGDARGFADALLTATTAG